MCVYFVVNCTVLDDFAAEKSNSGKVRRIILNLFLFSIFVTNVFRINTRI